MRKRGLPVNTHVVIAAAEGIVMNKYGTSSCDGKPMVRFNLTTDWAKSVLERMGYVKRKACSKAKVSIDHFETLKAEFLLEIKSIVGMDAIPAELVINFDQTALNYVPISHWTMDEEGAKRVEVVVKDDKRQITAVLEALQQEIFYHLNSSMRERLIAAFHSMISLKHGTLRKQLNIGQMSKL